MRLVPNTPDVPETRDYTLDDHMESQALIEKVLRHSLHEQSELPEADRSFHGIEIMLRVFGYELETDPTFAAPTRFAFTIERTGRTHP